MYLVKTPVWISKLSNRTLIWNIPTTEKKIYLSFDDGPIPGLTMDILKILSDYQAKATFFCVGENAQRYPELMLRIKDDKHDVGNHSFQHLNGWKTSTIDYINNVKKANEVIDSPLFRPPYGRITNQQIQHLKSNYKIIMWTLLSGDFEQKLSLEQCLFNVLQTKAGDIVVFHDNMKAQEKIIHVLPKFLEHFTQNGYQFCGLSEVLL